MTAADFAALLVTTANAALPYIGYGVAAGALSFGVIWAVTIAFRWTRQVAEDREMLADWAEFEARYEETYAVMIDAGWSEEDAEYLAEEHARQWTEHRS